MKPKPANDNTTRPAAFDAAIVAHIPAMRIFARKFVSYVDIDEVVNETVANALTHWANYDADKGAFVTWLQWRMRSVLTIRRAYKDCRAPYESAVDIEDVLATKSVPARQDDIADASQVVRRLSRTRNGRMLLRYGKGETHAEIGKRYGVNRQRVTALTGKARRGLVEREVA